MKALTLKHPWPYAICRLGKRIENRSWHPPKALIGQRFAIHGGVAPVTRADRNGVLAQAGHLIHEFGRSIGIYDATLKEVSLTGIVAIVTLESVLQPHEGNMLAWKDPGCYGWQLSDVFVLPEPIPCGGTQGLWSVPETIVDQITEQSLNQASNREEIKGILAGYSPEYLASCGIV